MFGTFILGIAAGWGAPYAEPRIKQAIGKAFPDEAPVEPREMALVSFAICLLAAAILAMLISSSHALPLALGAAVGGVGPRLVGKWRASRTPDYDS